MSFKKKMRKITHKNVTNRHKMLQFLYKLSICKPKCLWYNVNEQVAYTEKGADGMYSAMNPRSTADKIRNEHNLSEVPINLEEICRAKNIEFEYRNFCKVEEQVKKQVSGMIVTKKDNGTITEAKIYINEADPITRQRFTLAHELGHYFLHLMDESDTSIVSFRSSRNPREREADIFASELLMPTQLVQAECDELAFPTPSLLAAKFNVSRLAMKIKLDEMEIPYIG